MILVLLLLAIAAVAAWTVVSPQSAWRASQGWMVRNRSAVELSTAGRLAGRVVAGFVLVVALVSLVSL